jgi:S1-C subfamily serine protease
MTHTLSYRTAFSIMVAAFVATSAATFCVAFKEDHSAMPHQMADQLPGLTMEKAPVPEAGLVVTSLQSAGPAERAGLAVGDDVLAVDQKPVTSLGDVRDILRRHNERAVQLLVLHKDRAIDVSLNRSEDRVHGA